MNEHDAKQQLEAWLAEEEARDTKDTRMIRRVEKAIHSVSP